MCDNKETPYNQDVGRNCNLLYLMLNVVSRFSNKYTVLPGWERLQVHGITVYPC